MSSSRYKHASLENSSRILLEANLNVLTKMEGEKKKVSKKMRIFCSSDYLLDVSILHFAALEKRLFVQSSASLSMSQKCLAGPQQHQFSNVSKNKSEIQI